MNRRLRLPLAAAAFYLTGVAAVCAGVRPNTTPSLPMGLWFVSEMPEQPQRGLVAEFCLPEAHAAFARQRGYVGAGTCEDGSMPLLKPIAALPGDVVEITDMDVQVNGVAVVPAGRSEDGMGRPLPLLPNGTYRVRAGEVWLLSGHNPNSFDSRYFGGIPIASLARSARPLVTF